MRATSAAVPPTFAPALRPDLRQEVSICESGARIGGHGVAVERPWARRSHWYVSEPEAKGSFVRRVSDLRDSDADPVLIQRIEDRRVVEAVFYSRGLEGIERVALESRTGG